MARKKPKKTAQKQKKHIPEGIIYVNASFNNTMITITDRMGNVAAWSTPARNGFKHSKRGTPYAAQVAAKDVALMAIEFGMREVDILVRGPGQARETALRELSNHFKVLSITDKTPVPHNGCRPPKKRRV